MGHESCLEEHSDFFTLDHLFIPSVGFQRGWPLKFISLLPSDLHVHVQDLFRNRSQNSCHTLLDCHRTAKIEDKKYFFEGSLSDLVNIRFWKMISAEFKLLCTIISKMSNIKRKFLLRIQSHGSRSTFYKISPNRISTDEGGSF
jgi:hypothetical protein